MESHKHTASCEARGNADHCLAFFFSFADNRTSEEGSLPGSLPGSEDQGQADSLGENYGNRTA
jgi:hypothetical protein